jgi:hypothetical protein
VVDLDATFDQELRDVSIGQAVTQVLPHRDHDHLRREPGQTPTLAATTREHESGRVTAHACLDQAILQRNRAGCAGSWARL